MRQRDLLLISLITIFAAVSGCAHRVERPGAPALTGAPQSIKAAAIVELTKNTTEKGRALIYASSPDSFKIVIRGPLGTTGALIIGNKKGLTLVSRGNSTSYKPDDARIPLNISAVELVSLLLGKEKLAAEADASFEIQNIPGGKSVTKRRKGVILYRAAMTKYQRVEGFYLPFAISIDGGGYKLLVKYIKVNINPEIKKNLFKIKR